MVNLNKQGFLWRNFFFANYEGNVDMDEFMTRVELIADSKEQWMEQLMSENPDMELINACKEEIDYQRENLLDTIQEFVEYCSKNGNELPDKKELLEEIVKDDVKSGLYRILEDWKPVVDYANDIWNKLNSIYENNLYFLKDDLNKIIMDNLQNNKQVRKQVVN